MRTSPKIGWTRGPKRDVIAAPGMGEAKMPRPEIGAPCPACTPRRNAVIVFDSACSAAIWAWNSALRFRTLATSVSCRRSWTSTALRAPA